MFLGRYEVIRKLGIGGFGEVLLARSVGAEGFERIVALKRLRGELTRQHMKGIINEACIGGNLNHPNIVQVLDFTRVEAPDSSESDYLLVMEYVDGIALQDIFEADRAAEPLITPSVAIDIAIQVCEGLHYAHAARSGSGAPLRLIHRDIKPSNLMINRSGTVKIMDFGVAKSAINTGHSSTGTIKGTLRYLSPEQAEGSKDIGHASDLFSLGLVLGEMVIGRPVYEAEQEHLVLLRALQAQTGDAVREVDERVPGLGPILTRCLAYRPSDRFKSAEDLAQSLRFLHANLPLDGRLPEVVARASALRQQARTDEDGPKGTSFSLELRRKQGGPGWEVISSEALKGINRARGALEVPNLANAAGGETPEASSPERAAGKAPVPPGGPTPISGEAPHAPRTGSEGEGEENGDWEWEWSNNADMGETAAQPVSGKTPQPRPLVSGPVRVSSLTQDGPTGLFRVPHPLDSGVSRLNIQRPAVMGIGPTPPAVGRTPALSFALGVVLGMVLIGIGILMGLSMHQ